METTSASAPKKKGMSTKTVVQGSAPSIPASSSFRGASSSFISSSIFTHESSFYHGHGVDPFPVANPTSSEPLPTRNEHQEQDLISFDDELSLAPILMSTSAAESVVAANDSSTAYFSQQQSAEQEHQQQLYQQQEQVYDGLYYNENAADNNFEGSIIPVSDYDDDQQRQPQSQQPYYDDEQQAPYDYNYDNEYEYEQQQQQACDDQQQPSYEEQQQQQPDYDGQEGNSSHRYYQDDQDQHGYYDDQPQPQPQPQLQQDQLEEEEQQQYTEEEQQQYYHDYYYSNSDQYDDQYDDQNDDQNDDQYSDQQPEQQQSEPEPGIETGNSTPLTDNHLRVWERFFHNALVLKQQSQSSSNTIISVDFDSVLAKSYFSFITAYDRAWPVLTSPRKYLQLLALAKLQLELLKEEKETVDMELIVLALFAAIISDDQLTVEMIAMNNSRLLLATDDQGRSAVHHAATARNSPTLLALLYDCGVDLDAVDYHGCSCLHLAVLFKRSKIVAFLLQTAVDTELREIKNDKTALDLALTMIINSSTGGENMGDSESEEIVALLDPNYNSRGGSSSQSGFVKMIDRFLSPTNNVTSAASIPTVINGDNIPSAAINRPKEVDNLLKSLQTKGKRAESSNRKQQQQRSKKKKEAIEQLEQPSSPVLVMVGSNANNTGSVSFVDNGQMQQQEQQQLEEDDEEEEEEEEEEAEQLASSPFDHLAGMVWAGILFLLSITLNLLANRSSSNQALLDNEEEEDAEKGEDDVNDNQRRNVPRPPSLLHPSTTRHMFPLSDSINTPSSSGEDMQQWSNLSAPPTDSELLSKGLGFSPSPDYHASNGRKAFVPYQYQPSTIKPPPEVQVAIDMSRSGFGPSPPPSAAGVVGGPPPLGNNQNGYSLGSRLPQGVSWRYVNILPSTSSSLNDGTSNSEELTRKK